MVASIARRTPYLAVARRGRIRTGGRPAPSLVRAYKQDRSRSAPGRKRRGGREGGREREVPEICFRTVVATLGQPLWAEP